MKPLFDAKMRAATDATRIGNLTEATRLIQSALSGSSEQPSQALDASRVDKSADVLEPQDVQRSSATDRERIRYPLGEVIRSLRQGRDRLASFGPGAGVRPDPATPGGAQFVTRTAQDGRTFRFYIPSTAPRGLIVMLHGCQQNPQDFALGTGMNAAAEENSLLVAYPGQPQSANVSNCWNWFEPGHQVRGAGEPESLARLTQEILDEFGIADAFTAGLSAGGAMAAVMGEAYPELFKAVGVHSGLAPGSATDVISAFAAMRGDGRSATVSEKGVSLIAFQGSADAVVHTSNAEAMLRFSGVDAPDHVPEEAIVGGRSVLKSVFDQGRVELWRIEGAGHAWSGGALEGSFTDPSGPNASREMAQFFAKRMR